MGLDGGAAYLEVDPCGPWSLGIEGPSKVLELLLEVHGLLLRHLETHATTDDKDSD